jgi:hypothetical protein
LVQCAHASLGSKYIRPISPAASACLILLQLQLVGLASQLLLPCYQCLKAAAQLLLLRDHSANFVADALRERVRLRHGVGVDRADQLQPVHRR